MGKSNRMKDREKYLVKNTAIFAIGSFGTKIVNMLLVPLYSHILTTDEYGTIDLIFTICMFLEPIIMCNIGEGVKRFALDKNADFDEIRSISIIWIIIGCVVGSPLVYIINAVFLHSEFLILIYIYTIFLATQNVLLSYLKGQEKLLAFTIISIFTTANVAILNIVFLLMLRIGIKGYYLAYIISYFFAIVIALAVGGYKDVVKKFKFNKRLFFEISKFSIVLVPNSLIWWVINSSDRIMISHINGLSANGLFSVASKIPTLMSAVGSIFNQAWQFSAVKEGKSLDKTAYSNLMYNGLIEFLCLVTGIVFIFTKPAYIMFISKDYLGGWTSSVILTLGFTFLTMATFLGTTYYVEKNMVGNLLSAIFGGVFNIVLNFLLINKIGILGAAVATSMSYIFIFLYRVIDTKKYINLRINIANKINLLFICLMCFFIVCDNELKTVAYIMYIAIVIHNMKDICNTINIIYHKIRRG